MPNYPRIVRYTLPVVLGLCVLVTFVITASWPLTGDASLMHYVVFLLRHGAKPYRDVVDINLPGTYLTEALAMSLFGASAVGLRIYDCVLTIFVVLGCISFTGSARWFTGSVAGLVFALVHVQDGVAQQAQRDLLLTALMLAALTLFRLLRCARSYTALLAFAFGLAFGLTFTIKPVLLPLCLLLLLLGHYCAPALRKASSLASVALGLILPMFIAFAWLAKQECLGSFVQITESLLPLHASLGKRPLAYLLMHSFSPLGALLALTLPLLLLNQRKVLKQRDTLLVSIVGTLLAYVLQGKGYAYQRYPLVVVLLLVIASILESGLLQHGRVRVMAYALACWAGCQGISFGWKASHISPAQPFVSSLSDALLTLGDAKSLDGQVQCLDTFGGCINTLYKLRVRQSTGYLYDCYLFTEPGPARSHYREQFQKAWIDAQPRLVVLTSQNCFKDFTNGYNRLAMWPELDLELRTHYREVSRWQPSGPTSWLSAKGMPFGYRLLVRTR